ncbi:hypothetical protein SNOG_13572 [Parastagonospora nodorum SN15]|uniref:UTP23 sensor motif region domain-containing protein n=1 Tax=Phaeosphaeria nodorum (strain SN15 / ATCC MYA-4574 / FGSC 10173) TaxID=321614 RepID=Q0U3U2_PHANO|nr:hypothetical protein SNOG_13572 [Parastagonospora nodorum SN15]EAT79019.1 hypothetical protein SNOG_13572 [Parastagonospora nodorum SN15]
MVGAQYSTGPYICIADLLNTQQAYPQSLIFHRRKKQPNPLSAQDYPILEFELSI